MYHLKNPRNPRDPQEFFKSPRDTRDFFKNPWNPRDPRNLRDPRDVFKNPRDLRNPREPRNLVHSEFMDTAHFRTFYWPPGNKRIVVTNIPSTKNYMRNFNMNPDKKTLIVLLTSMMVTVHEYVPLPP